MYARWHATICVGHIVLNSLLRKIQFSPIIFPKRRSLTPIIIPLLSNKNSNLSLSLSLSLSHQSHQNLLSISLSKNLYIYARRYRCRKDRRGNGDCDGGSVPGDAGAIRGGPSRSAAGRGGGPEAEPGGVALRAVEAGGAERTGEPSGGRAGGLPSGLRVRPRRPPGARAAATDSAASALAQGRLDAGASG